MDSEGCLPIMKVSTQKALTVIFGILSFPFFAAGTFNGKAALKMEKMPNLEAFLAPAVAAEIPTSYPYEAVKAQVILLRSRCYEKLDQGTALGTVIGELIQSEELSETENTEMDRMCAMAVGETENLVLKYGGKTVNGPFFRTGNGMTRSGRDLFQNDQYPWLVNVESPWDIDSEEYMNSISFSPEKFAETLEQQEEGSAEKIWGLGYQEMLLEGTLSAEGMAESIQITGTDQAGYVTEISVGDVVFAGESFRKIMDLPSACFSVQVVDEKLRFLCKGLGHGAGLSQTGAAAMAEEGKDALEILQYYFPQATVEERYRVNGS